MDLVLRLQRPAKTSRSSFTPSSTDRMQRCETSRPRGAKPSHEGHSRVISEEADRIVDHSPGQCPDCLAALSSVYLPQPGRMTRDDAPEPRSPPKACFRASHRLRSARSRRPGARRVARRDPCGRWVWGSRRLSRRSEGAATDRRSVWATPA